MGAITKTFDRIIPNEIKPIVPVAAAMFGAPYLGAILPGAGATGIMGALRAGAIAGGTNIGTQALMGQKIDPRSAATSALLAGVGSGLGNITGTGKLATVGKRVGEILAPTTYSPETGFALTGTGEGLSAITQPVTVAATTGGTLAAIDAAEKANQEYEKMLQQQGMTDVTDTAARRDYIRRYMGLAGFNDDEINEALSKYGYANGGRAGYANGGSSLYDKASDMNRLALEIKLINLGYGGFGGKDLEAMTDEEIKKLYEEATSKANGGRIGYEIGGPVKTFIAKMMGIEPDEKILNRLFEERKKEIFNSMFDPEVPSTNYTMQQMQEADAIATEQAMKELEDYKRRLGMKMDNPPKGTVGADVIEQIMGPRKEGRVKEAKGGRIGYADGGYTPIDWYDELHYKMYLDAIENGVISPDMSYEDWTDEQNDAYFQRRSEDYKKGGRIGYKEGKYVGGYDPIKYGNYEYEGLYEQYLDDRDSGVIKMDMSFADYIDMLAEKYDYNRTNYAGGKMVKKQNTGRVSQLFQQIEDGVNVSEAMAELLNVYGIDLYDSKAKGGIMNLAIGGMPAEMDLRPGGFVPIGKKERADDVPARLSKNEFVFTADAVRAAGGGSVNKGAQRMYDLMNSLEARV